MLRRCISTFSGGKEMEFDRVKEGQWADRYAR